MKVGWVFKATSKATWDADLPIILTKCQYFLEETASLWIFPTNSAYVLVAVSKPKEVSIYSFFKSPSIVLGTPTKVTSLPLLLKNSANNAALVLESSPPTTTTASIWRSFITLKALSIWEGVSILVLPEPNISDPPVFLYLFINSSSTSI